LPTVLRSRLPLLALAASIFACMTAVPALSGDTAAVRSARAQTHPKPIVRPAPRRHILKHFRKKRTLGQRAARIALRAVGLPYRWGGTSPSSGFDCSGLVYWAYGRLGIELPHSSYALAQEGRPVRSRLRPGDLLFFSGYGHVGIYVGHGRMVHAPHSGTRVQVVRLGRSHYGDQVMGARRVTRA
jgi:cell wall-associated NlpC family hydrolase